MDNNKRKRRVDETRTKKSKKDERIPRLTFRMNEGWVDIEFNNQAAWDVKSMILVKIKDFSSIAFHMDKVHRLSRMYIELDRSGKLEMLSKEDMQAISTVLPLPVEDQFRFFYSRNFIREDKSRFKEANMMTKSLYQIHES